MSRKAAKKFFFGLRVFLLVFAAAVAGALWQFDRSLPPFAMRWLERRLSSGTFSYSFDHASFNLLRGVKLENARIHMKRTLAPPLLRVGELRLDWDADFDNPVYTWVRTVYARDLVVSPFDELPESSSSGGGVDIEGMFRKISEEHDWAVRSRHVVLERAKIFDMPCRFIEFDVSIRDAVLRIENLCVAPDAPGFMESLRGEATFDPAEGKFRTAVAGTITPDVIRGLTLVLDGDTAVEYYDAVTDLDEPLSVSGEIIWVASGDPVFDPRQDMRATIQGADFRFRGRPVRRLKMGLQWLVDPANAGEDGKKLVISPVAAVFADGTLNGGLVWYPRTHATDLQASAALPVSSLASVIDEELPGCLTNFVFATPPRVSVRGRLFGGPFRAKSVLGGEIDAENLSVYRTELSDFHSAFSMSGYEKLGFGGITATCQGGAVTGRVDLAFPPDDADSFDASLSLVNCGSDYFRQRLGLVGAPSKGLVSADVNLSGALDMDKLGTFNGDATVKVRDAALLRIPLFAGLTDFLGRNIMGVDLLLMQSDSDLRATITNGLVTIDRFTLDGNLLSLVAKGKCRLDAEGCPIEGVAQVRFFHSRSLIGKLARLVTLPVSKFMEFRVYGPISGPSWNYIGILDRIAEATFWPRDDATAGENTARKNNGVEEDSADNKAEGGK